MERTERAAVMPVSYGWSDVGSWQAVWELSERDADGNAAQGPAVFVDTRGFYARARSSMSRFSASITCRRDDRRRGAGGAPGKHRWIAERRRTAQAGGAGAHAGPSESAPAVGLLSIARSRRSLPGQAHRGEAGRPAVAAAAPPPGRALGDRSRHGARRSATRCRCCTKTNWSMCRSAPHRLENSGKIDLELIEVQTGSYLGEDDIERIEDDYHRS